MILDKRMPGTSGIELQRKPVASHSEIEVIFITAYEEEGTRAQALRDGVGVLLIKPVRRAGVGERGATRR